VDDRLARIGARHHVVENSKTITFIGVCVIVSEDSNFLVLRAYFHAGRWSHSVLLEIIPVAVSVRTCSMVVNEVVVWICNPETARRSVSV